MAQTIKLRRSATASAVPTTGQLALGELAINTFDGKLFLKKDNGTQSIVEIGAGGSGSSVTISTTAPVSPSAGDLWWDSTNGLLKIYYNDGTSSQWVDAFTSGYPDVVPVSSGGTGKTTAPAARDALAGYTTTAKSGGTTTLTNTSTYTQFFTGASTHTVTMPDATTLTLGWSYRIVNLSAADLTVRASGAVFVYTIPAYSVATLTTVDISAAVGNWYAIVDGFSVGTVPVANGGTGLVSLTAKYIPFGNGTSAFGSSSDLTWDNTAKDLYVNGQVGVCVTPSSTTQLQVGNIAVGGATSAQGVYVSQTAPATMTASYTCFQSTPNTTAASFTLGSLYHFSVTQGSIGAGSAITNQYGFYVNGNMLGATNNFGFHSNIPAATGDWNFYAAGTANNYFAGDTGIGIAPDGTQFLHIGAGTAAKAPIELNAGTNMSTVDPGSVEYDGTCLYFTPFGTSRSAIREEQLVVLGATNTLTSQTGAQPLFDNATAGGAVTLAVGTYQFECFFSLTAMSATSGSFGFALVAGTAVIGSQGWRSVANKAALATASNGLITYNTAANTTLATANTTTTGQAYINGVFRVTTAGTIVPSVSLGVAAAAVVGVQSYFKVSPISPTGTAATNLTVGNWS